MSDVRLRALERRWQETGSVEDRAAWLLERVRTGEIQQQDLELLSFVGDPAARAALPEWEPKIPVPTRGDGELLEPGAWSKRLRNEGKLESFTMHDPQSNQTEVSLRCQGCTVRKVVSDRYIAERFRAGSSDRIQAEIVGVLETDLRALLAHRVRLPLLDFAHALEYQWGLRGLILVGVSAARFMLDLWEAGYSDAYPQPRLGLSVVEQWLISSAGSAVSAPVAKAIDAGLAWARTRPIMVDTITASPEGPARAPLSLLQLIADPSRSPGQWPLWRHFTDILWSARDWADIYADRKDHAPGCLERGQDRPACPCGILRPEVYLMDKVIRPGLVRQIVGG